MPTYRVKEPETGKTLRFTGDSPPTEQEIEDAFSQISVLDAPLNVAPGRPHLPPTDRPPFSEAAVERETPETFMPMPGSDVETPTSDRGSLIALGAGMKTTLIDAPNSLRLSGLESMGIVPPGTTSAFNGMTQIERDFVGRQFREQFGESIVLDFAEEAGKIIPFMAIPGGVGAAGKGISGAVQRIAGTSGTSAVATAALTPDEPGQEVQQNVDQAKTGAFLGAIFQKAIEISQFLPLFINRMLARPLGREGIPGVPKNVNSLSPAEQIKAIEQSSFARSSREFDEGLEVFDKAGKFIGRDIPFTIRDLTSDTLIQMLDTAAEAAVKGARVARETAKLQVEATLSFWNRALSRIDSKISGGGSFGARALDAWEKTMGIGRHVADPKGLFNVRTGNAIKLFGQLDRVSKGEKNLGVSNFKGAVNKLIDALDAPDNLLGGASKQLRQELLAIRSELTKVTTTKEVASNIVDAKGAFFKESITKTSGRENVSAKELQILLNRYGKVAGGTGRLFSDKVDKAEQIGIAKFLFSNLLKDLDGASAAGDEAAAALASARQVYFKDTEAIRNVQNSALGRLFGKKEGTLTYDQIDDFFIKKMSPEDIRVAFNVLDSSDPQLKLALQRSFIARTLEEAQKRGRFDKEDFSVGRMFDLVKSTDKFDAVFSGEEKEIVKLGFDLTERIVLKNAGNPSGALPALKQAAGTAISMSPTFIARALAEMLAPFGLIKSFRTPSGAVKLRMERPATTGVRVPSIAGQQISEDESRDITSP